MEGGHDTALRGWWRGDTTLHSGVGGEGDTTLHSGVGGGGKQHCTQGLLLVVVVGDNTVIFYLWSPDMLPPHKDLRVPNTSKPLAMSRLGAKRFAKMFLFRNRELKASHLCGRLGSNNYKQPAHYAILYLSVLNAAVGPKSTRFCGRCNRR